MRRFTELYWALDGTNKTGEKLAHLREYFASDLPENKAWAIFLLTGRKRSRPVRTRDIRAWAAEAAGLPEWLFEASYSEIGDLAETVALVTGSVEENTTKVELSELMEAILPALKHQSNDDQKRLLKSYWSAMSFQERFVFNKLITGGFRVGVSNQLVLRALAEHTGVDAAILAHRLMGDWIPGREQYEKLVTPEADAKTASGIPYPFCLAHASDLDSVNELETADYLVEWKWDGIRAQVLKRESGVFLWSRGEQLLNEKFPDLTERLARLPTGTVLDGEIVAWKDGILPFTDLQTRLNRKRVTKKLIETVPVRYIVFDILEKEGTDCRREPLVLRRKYLEDVMERMDDERFVLSEVLQTESPSELANHWKRARSVGTEGLMIKRYDALYASGRKRGVWWKLKSEPFSADAVMIYAQAGHGRRAGLFTDYTFAVWKDNDLVPFAKAYSGLSDKEIIEVDRFVRNNTIERFGPVRRVKPEMVFEIAFENIAVSKRHKSGIAVRFPRIRRIRWDKKASEADTIETLNQLLVRFSK